MILCVAYEIKFSICQLHQVPAMNRTGLTGVPLIPLGVLTRANATMVSVSGLRWR